MGIGPAASASLASSTSDATSSEVKGEVLQRRHGDSIGRGERCGYTQILDTSALSSIITFQVISFSSITPMLWWLRSTYQTPARCPTSLPWLTNK